MTSAGDRIARVRPRIRPWAGWALWAWPVAAGALAAWPVWRSLFPETPDVAVGDFAGEAVLAVAEIGLCLAWLARFRSRMTGYWPPLVAIAVAAVVLASRHGDTATDAAVTDMAALAIAWLVTTFLFAGSILLEGQAAFARRYGTPVAPVRMTVRAHRMIGIWLAVFAMVVAGVLHQAPWGYLYAMLAVVSPGAILAWAALCDCARGILMRRTVFVADLGDLPVVADHKHILFGGTEILVSDRLKVATILPAGDQKPGDVVSIAAAVLSDDTGDWAHAVQDFGVSHRVRVPSIKPIAVAIPGAYRGKLQDRRVVEVASLADSHLSEEDSAAIAEPVARAEELHRVVLALREVEPTPRLLGLLILAKVARPGATETVRGLRKAGFTVEVAGPAIAPVDEEAMTGLGFSALSATGFAGRKAIKVLRPGQAAPDSTPTTVHFGARVPPDAGLETEILVTRDDPRTLVDLIQFARDLRRRIPITLALASLPGVALLIAVFGLVSPTPLLITIVAVSGILLAAASPQVLRLSPAVANEVDEE